MEKVGRLLATSAAGLAVQAGLLLLSGVLVATQYVSTLAGAHGSVEAIRGSSFYGALDRYHYWGSMVLLIHGSLHLTVMLWAGWYKTPNQWRWTAAWIVCLCAFLFQVTGNLFQMDRHSVQTTVIEAGIAARVPLVGTDLRTLVLSGQSFSQNTLSTWVSIHKWLLPLLLVVGGLSSLGTLFKRRDHSVSQLGAAIPAILTLVLCATFAVPSGPSATVVDYTSFDTGPNWYTWPMDGLLAMFNRMGSDVGWLGAALIPGLFFTFIALLPGLSKKLSDGAVRLIFLIFVGLTAFATIVFGVSFPSPLTRPVPTTPVNPTVSTAPMIDRKLAAKGKELFETIGCTGCHGIDGSQGTIGPDLTNEYRRHPDADWYVRYINNPPKVKPGSTMPAFSDLTVYQRKALAEFIRHAPSVRNSR